MSPKKPDSFIYIVGYTEAKEAVVGGLWKMYETYGIPLDIIFDACMRRNSIPGWIDLYQDMKKSGMEHGRILSKLEEAINDSFGKEYSGVVISRLSEIFKPQE
jgi:alanyl-tRNA synthetase